MAPIDQSTCRNRLLAAMTRDDFARLPLEPVPLAPRQVLMSPHAPAMHAFFVERGFVSVTTMESRGQVEVGMVGREGLACAVPTLLRADRSPLSCLVQLAGEAYRVCATDLLAAVAASDGLQALLLRYVQSFLVQSAYTVFSNTAFTIEVRLSRWLLMCHDRAEGDDMNVTHEILSTMLGVRRPGITVAVQVLEGHGLIKATRGRITVLDRPGLRALADRSYGVAEAEYTRLLARPDDHGLAP